VSLDKEFLGFLRIIVPPTSGSNSPSYSAQENRVHYTGMVDAEIERTEQIASQVRWY